MLHSLRTRLLATFLVVVLVAVGTIAVFANSIVRTEFQNYIRQDEERYMSVASLVSDYTRQSPDETQLRLEHIAQNYGERVLLVNGNSHIVADSDGNLQGVLSDATIPSSAIVIYAGANGVPALPSLGPNVGYDMVTLPAPTLSLQTTVRPYPDTFELSAVHIPLVAEFGDSRSAPAPESGGVALPVFVSARVGTAAGVTVDPVEEVFINSVTHSLWLAMGVAGLAALGMTVFLSRRIIAPIEALTRAATRLEKGDLSQRVMIDSKDEIGTLAHAFNEMAGGLSRLEQLRRQMVTDIAHELRTPLSNIRGYLEAVQDGIVHPNPAVISSLHEEAMALTHLVEELQELSLAEARQLPLQRQRIALKPLVGSVVAKARMSTATSSAPTIQIVAEDVPLIDIDPTRIGQVLRNLLTNALRHTPPDGMIVVSLHPVPNAVELSVTDTGRGIPETHLPHIFERFYRADPARARATGGAGLGLAIVKQWVELHGGTITAESEVGVGSRFSVRLPLRSELKGEVRQLPQSTRLPVGVGD